MDTRVKSDDIEKDSRADDVFVLEEVFESVNEPVTDEEAELVLVLPALREMEAVWVRRVVNDEEKVTVLVLTLDTLSVNVARLDFDTEEDDVALGLGVTELVPVKVEL